MFGKVIGALGWGEEGGVAEYLAGVGETYNGNNSTEQNALCLVRILYCCVSTHILEIR